LEIDNNLTEQEIKPFVIARNNFLFCDSVAGAKALCLHFGLIRTAILHGHDPYAYYVKILQEIPYCQTVEDYEKLLPWNINLIKIQADKHAA
jgi:transposase